MIERLVVNWFCCPVNADVCRINNDYCASTAYLSKHEIWRSIIVRGLREWCKLTGSWCFRHAVKIDEEDRVDGRYSLIWRFLRIPWFAGHLYLKGFPEVFARKTRKKLQVVGQLSAALSVSWKFNRRQDIE